MINTTLDFQDVEKNHVYLVHLQLDQHIGEDADLVHLVIAQSEEDAAQAVAHHALQQHPQLAGLSVSAQAMRVSTLLDETVLELLSPVIAGLPEKLRQIVGYAVYATLEMEGFTQSFLEQHFAALKALDSVRVQLAKSDEMLEKAERELEESRLLVQRSNDDIKAAKSIAGDAIRRAFQVIPGSLPLLEWRDEGEEGWQASVYGWTLTARDRNWHLGREGVGIAAPRPNRASAAENRRAAEDMLFSMGVRFVSTEKREP